MVKVVLKSGKDQSARRLHPWVFSGAIKKFYGEPYEGCMIEVFDNKDEFLGIGHYQVGSIAVRILSFEKTEIDQDFWNRKISNAWNYRKNIGIIDNDKTNVFRLIHAEGDELPGLIVDFYNGTAVVQMHSVGMYKNRDQIINAIRDVAGDKIVAIYDKSSTTLPFKADLNATDGYIYGESNINEVSENGLKFKIDWKKGQKTGFFVDQRENRQLVREISAGKKVLNVFGYTGGFSVYAMAGGAELVHTVDSSARAVELADENIALNFSDTERHKSFAVDAFDFIENMKDDYDVVILDPPAFAKHNNVLHNALQGYKKLNLKAMQKMKPGSILVTFSCSQVVSKEEFRKSVFAAATQCGKTVRIMKQLTQPSDHPVNIFHPESEYLKGLVLYLA